MKISLRQIRRLILGVIFFILVGGTGYYFGLRKVSLEVGNNFPKVRIERSVPQERESVDFALFWQVWDRLEENYLERKKLDYRKMVYGSISGMVASLGDPYSVFLPPTENQESKDDLRGDFEGVGIQIGFNKDQKLVVIAPLSGTPAEESGIKAGDLILRITDEKKGVDKDTSGINLLEAVRLIRGPKNSTVKLEIQREGAKDSFVVALKRDTIVVKSVEVRLEDPQKTQGKKVAILKLSRFGERTYQEWQEAVEEIKRWENNNEKQNFAGVVLDLRNNPGGFLQGAVFIASEFLSSGVVVLQDKGADGKETFSVNRTGGLFNEPLVVLINGGSASASEIVAGVLQERGRAKLVGEKTFGKGTIQEAEDLPGGAGLHITVARWLLPSGKSLDKEGVKPDFEVKVDEKDQTKDLPLEKAVELLTK